MLIGKRINDRYKVIELIGGGGMANVYLARDVILERYVAIKILRLDLANDEDLIRRFRREAQSATSLVHPNIVSIFDVGEENDIYYIVMEYVEGQTLKQYIQNHSPIPLEKATDIMLQLTAAIKHAHQNNIIHRDIKPQNILIDKKGHVKITDFGIAMAITATTITHTNSVLGSVHYISPEQARGGLATKKSDIYSLGIVMFEMLTGRLPFQGESAVSIALKHLQDETPSPRRWNPNIPQSVENIILKATVKDPFYRHENVDELEEDIRTCLNEDRLNEPPFARPYDDQATKAIPVIKDEKKFHQIQDTIVHDKGQKNQENSSEATNKTQKKKKWPWIVSILSALIIIVGILAITAFPKWFGPKDIPVPDVTNYELADAIEALEEAGFEIGEEIPITDDEVEENHVIRTDPKAGRNVKEGSVIKLYVSIGKEKLTLNNYEGRQYEDVIRLLGSVFKDIEKNEVFDESAPGTIIKQEPAAGEEVVPEETILVLTVSKGVETITLADLTEYSRSALQQYESSTGLKIEVASEEYHDTIPAGFVISQDPAPNTEVKKGETIKVTVSKGKEELPPKTVKKDILIPYNGDGEELVVRIYIDDMNHSLMDAVETFTITENTTKTLEFLIAHGEKARYVIEINGERVMEDTVDYPE